MAAGIYLIGQKLEVPAFAERILPALERVELEVPHFYGVKPIKSSDVQVLTGISSDVRSATELGEQIHSVLSEVGRELFQYFKENPNAMYHKTLYWRNVCDHDQERREEEEVEEGEYVFKDIFTPHFSPVGYFSDEGLLPEAFATELRKWQVGELEESTDALFKKIRKRVRGFGKALAEMD